MKKSLLASLLFLITALLHAQGPYAPAAGMPGSTAISKDSSIIVSWASGAFILRGFVQADDTTVYADESNKASFGHHFHAMGAAEGSSTEVVSLGDGGMATLTFDRIIYNGPGADFAVFENSFGDTFLELAFVEVSSDGINYSRFPAHSLTPTDVQTGAWDETNPTQIHNLAGKYRQGFGTPFDLCELAPNPLVDINFIRFIRIVDVVGSINPVYGSVDSQGNLINDPYPTPFNSGGFDLDGVAVLHGNVQNPLLGFEELLPATDSYFLPLENGSFSSDDLKFNYEAGFGSWSGFSYSNRVTLTGEYTNDQFIAASLGGIEGDSSSFAISYVSSDWMSGTYDPIPSVIETSTGNTAAFSGFYVNNSHMAYITMRDGTLYNKKFGGVSGNDPDWFRLKIWGVRSDNSITDTVVHYLADFRFTDHYNDYIQTDWQWVDLMNLGEVKSLSFILESSDTGDYGMNTPAYFCMDNMSLVNVQAPVLNVNIPDLTVAMNAEPVEIQLSDHFHSYSGSINWSVTSNSQPGLVSASLNGNVLALTFTANETGTADIEITATASGLSVSDFFTVTVSSNVGIIPIPAISFTAFPNPAGNNLMIEGAGNSQMQLRTLAGQLLMEQELLQEKTEIDLSQLPSGVYLLQIANRAGTSVKKIVKK